jgi:hypothetical protein
VVPTKATSNRERFKGGTMRPLFLLFAINTAFATSLSAQSKHVQTGDQVRIAAGPVSGRFTVLEVNADTMLLREGTGGQEIRVGFTSVDQIARRENRTSWQGAKRGAGLGLLVGGLMGAVAGLASGDDECSGFCVLTLTAEEKAFVLGITGGATGVVLGGVIGLASPGQRWVEVSLPSFRRASLMYSRGSIGIGYSVRL